MVKMTSQFLQSNNKASPGELLKMLRLRSGFTQAKLAELLGLKSPRMVRNWEGDFNFPTPERLRLLIDLYLERNVFVPGEESLEIRQLWHSVKNHFETHNFNGETYPIFDEKWLTTLLQQPPELPTEAIPSPNEQPKTTPNNLPSILKPLFGRELDLARIEKWLEQPDIRLVTLSGIGGSGKTSLAIAVGQQLLNTFSDGVFLIELENVTAQEIMLAQLARTLFLSEVIGGKGLLQELKLYLKDKDMLLILDNFEQLVNMAGTLVEILKETSRVKLLVTSRISLQLSFEHEYLLNPLAIPNTEVITDISPEKLLKDYAGIAMFVERAETVKPGFRLTSDNERPVMEICSRLDGLPLALELAAARIRAFTPQELLERLSLKLLVGGSKDLPSRQQSLHQTIALSYELLTGEEQKLFVRLSVFAGGCTLEAVEAVCNSESDLAIEVFELLESILTKNLLKSWEGKDGSTRYGMLVTIREYGLEKLAEIGEKEKLLQNFLAYYQNRLSKLATELGHTNAVILEEAIDSEYTNLLLALESGDIEFFYRIIGIMGLYWARRGLSEGLHFLEYYLTLPTNTEASRATFLMWSGRLSNVQGGFENATRYALESLTLFRQLGDKVGIANSLLVLGIAYYNKGEYEQAYGNFSESLGLSRGFSHFYELRRNLVNLSSLAILLGDYQKARDYISECFNFCQEHDEEDSKCDLIANLGWLELLQSNYNEARRCFEESLALSKERNNMGSILNNVKGLGCIDLQQGQYLEATRYFEINLANTRQVHFTAAEADTLACLGFASLLQGEYSEALCYLKDALIQSKETGYSGGVIQATRFLGILAYLQADDLNAGLLLEESLVLTRKLSMIIELTLILTFLGLLTLKQGKETAAVGYFRESLNVSWQQGDKFSVAQNLTGLLTLLTNHYYKCSQTDQPHLFTIVVLLSGSISTLLSSTESVMFRPLQDLYFQNLDLARTKLDPLSFEVVWLEGVQLPLEDAITLILSETNRVKQETL